jgi:hypothetical protein
MENVEPSRYSPKKSIIDGTKGGVAETAKHGALAPSSKAETLGTGTGPLEMGVRPGFIGQLFVPVPDPSVASYYFATNSYLYRPALLTDVIANPSNYYPTPVDSSAATKRQVFENGIPIYNSKDNEVTVAQNLYTDPDLVAASIDSNYSYLNNDGYISLPIGTAQFMQDTTIGAANVVPPYTGFNFTNGYPNDFSKALFVPNVLGNNALVYSTLTGSGIAGHLVIPVYN